MQDSVIGPMVKDKSDEATEPFVRIIRVSKTYQSAKGDIHALDDISIDVGAGEFLSIVGPSGCGKSTLVMLVAGLLPISEGVIEINGEVVRKPRTDVGIVFQDPILLDWRTVLQNIMLQIEFRKLDTTQHRRRALELLRYVGLEGFENKPPYELSGGMRQRVSICRALIHDPPLLLMDEPFGAVDALTREQIGLDLLAIWQRSQKTVVFITHSITEAVFLSDRVLVMTPRPGKIAEMIYVDLGRPRSLAMVSDAAFGMYCKRIRDIFKAQGVLQDTERRLRDVNLSQTT